MSTDYGLRPYIIPKWYITTFSDAIYNYMRGMYIKDVLIHNETNYLVLVANVSPVGNDYLIENVKQIWNFPGGGGGNEN